MDTVAGVHMENVHQMIVSIRNSSQQTVGQCSNWCKMRWAQWNFDKSTSTSWIVCFTLSFPLSFFLSATRSSQNDRLFGRDHIARLPVDDSLDYTEWEQSTPYYRNCFAFLVSNCPLFSIAKESHQTMCKICFAIEIHHWLYWIHSMRIRFCHLRCKNCMPHRIHGNVDRMYMVAMMATATTKISSTCWQRTNHNGICQHQLRIKCYNKTKRNRVENVAIGMCTIICDNIIVPRCVRGGEDWGCNGVFFLSVFFSDFILSTHISILISFAWLGFCWLMLYHSHSVSSMEFVLLVFFSICCWNDGV